MDSDDDLIVAPAKAPAPASNPIMLDDSDDDLLPMPKPAPGAASPINLDSDDDLPPPPKAAAAAASPRGPQATHVDPTKPAAAAAPRPAATPAPAAAAAPTQAEIDDALRNAKTFKRKQQHKEGFLFKQQPVWPYGAQKRWCVLQGRMFSYYDSQGAAKPSAALDLKGAIVTANHPDAKQPNSFGISNITSGSSGTGGSAALKGRTFVFSALNKEEVGEWMTAIQSALVEPASEVHWFEKLAQGVY